MRDYRLTRLAAYTGSISQAVVITIAPLLFVIFQGEFGLTDEQTGRLILINFGTQIIADLIATRYADRVGYRPSILAAQVLCTLGLVSMSFSPYWFVSPYTGLCFSVVLYAFGGGFIEVLLSPVVEAMPGDEKASIMALFHSFFCWGQAFSVLVTTLIIRWLGSGIWRSLPVCWSIVPALGIVLFSFCPIAPITPEGKGMSIKELVKQPVFMIAMLMMICSGSSELTMSQWASLFAEKGLHVSKFMGDLLGPFLFAITMGTGRALFGKIGSRVDLRKSLMLLSTMSIGCYLLTVLGNGVFSLVGCALCGFSVSLMWPGTLSLSSRLYPLGGTAMFGVLAICGDIGGSMGPWFAGAVSDLLKGSGSLIEGIVASTGLDAEQAGLKAGLLLGMIFPVMMFICSARMPVTAENRKKG